RCATDPARTELDTLSLHDALPIYHGGEHPLPPRPLLPQVAIGRLPEAGERAGEGEELAVLPALPAGGVGRVVDVLLAAGRVVPEDRKSTRLNSSHVKISYAVFCLK